MTHIQRLESIITGVIDAAPTNAQTTKVANAFVDSKDDAYILELTGTARASLTNAQKAQIAVLTIKNIIKETVRIAPKEVVTRSIMTTADGDSSDL